MILFLVFSAIVISSITTALFFGPQWGVLYYWTALTLLLIVDFAVTLLKKNDPS